MKRPFSALTAVGTAAHHGFELRSGVGLVFEPFLGRGPALALWGTYLPAQLYAAVAGEERFDGWLALNNGAGFVGGVIHFLEWPWELRGGIPTLTEAEGMTVDRVPTYNRVLQLWTLAAALALLLETPGHARKWALAGIALGEPLRLSARHHFRWARQQALREPERWSPALRA